jgi:hypothetical protein
MDEIAQRLEQDRLLLETEFGVHGDVVRLVFPAGDEHRRGRATALIHFSCGRAVAYKPRPQSLVNRLRAIADTLSARCPALAVRFPTALERGPYGWAAYIEALDPAGQPDVNAHYHRLGQAAALTWALAGRDIHMGNVILAEDALHIIDEEVFGIGVVSDDPAMPTPLREEMRFFEASPVHTGVFPYLTPLPGRDQGVDFSPYSRLRAALAPDQSAPAGSGPLLDADADAFLGGYRAMLRTFAEAVASSETFRRQVLGLAAETCRMVPLPTARYAELLTQSLRPDLLASGAARVAFFDKHLRADSAFKPWRSALISDEVGELFRGDVPLFHSPVASRLATVPPVSSISSSTTVVKPLSVTAWRASLPNCPRCGGRPRPPWNVTPEITSLRRALLHTPRAPSIAMETHSRCCLPRTPCWRTYENWLSKPWTATSPGRTSVTTLDGTGTSAIAVPASVPARRASS